LKSQTRHFRLKAGAIHEDSQALSHTIALAAEVRLRDNRPLNSQAKSRPMSSNVMEIADDEQQAADIVPFPAMGRALVHRNFRLFIVGQGISVLGSWMQQLATVWLVYRLSKSSVLLGLADFTAMMPAAMLLPLAGVLADRWNRHRTVIATQFLAMLQAFLLMALTMSGLISVWQVLVLGTVLGIINALDCTARQAFMVDMVPRPEDLGNAIAINSSVFNAARLVGPAIAGVVIGLCGEWPCFMLNGLSYLAVLASLLAMDVRPAARATSDIGIIAGLREGLSYIARSMPIRTILLLLGIMSMMSAPLTILMPLLATEVLHGGPYSLGLLTAALGAGALIASLALAARTSVIGLNTVIAAATAAFGLGLAGLSFSHSLGLALLIMLATGFAMVTQMAASNAVLQTIVDEEMRGRVMSFYTLAFFGMGPLGSLSAGALARTVGIRATYLMFGGVTLIAAAGFTALLPLLRRAIRPLYVRAGILPMRAEKFAVRRAA
jgi:MFS family permease